MSQNVFAVWHAESDGVMGVHAIYDVDLLPYDAGKGRGVFVCVGRVDLSAEGARLLAPLVVHDAERRAGVRVRIDVVMRTEYEIAEGVPRVDEVLWHGARAHLYAGHFVPAGRQLSRSLWCGAYDQLEPRVVEVQAAAEGLEWVVVLARHEETQGIHFLVDIAVIFG